MVEGKEILNLTVAESESIVYPAPIQCLDVVCYTGMVFLNWNGDAAVDAPDCLKLVEKSSYTIRAARPFTNLNIAGAGGIAVVMK